MSDESKIEETLSSIISSSDTVELINKELEKVLKGSTDLDSIFIISDHSSLAPLTNAILTILSMNKFRDSIYLFDSYMSGETKPTFKGVTNLFYCAPRTFWEKVDACKLENRIFVTFNKPAEVHLPLTVGERCINFVFTKNAAENSETLIFFPSLITSLKESLGETPFGSHHNSAILKVAETLIRYRTFCWSKKLNVRFKGKGERLSSFDMIVIIVLFYELPIDRMLIQNVLGPEEDEKDPFNAMFKKITKALENNFYYENMIGVYKVSTPQIRFGVPNKKEDTFDLFVYVGDEGEKNTAAEEAKTAAKVAADSAATAKEAANKAAAAAAAAKEDKTKEDEAKEAKENADDSENMAKKVAELAEKAAKAAKEKAAAGAEERMQIKFFLNEHGTEKTISIEGDMSVEIKGTVEIETRPKISRSEIVNFFRRFQILPLWKKILVGVFACGIFITVIAVIIKSSINKREADALAVSFADIPALTVFENAPFAPMTLLNSNGTIIYGPPQFITEGHDVLTNYCFATTGPVQVFNINIQVNGPVNNYQIVLSELEVHDYCVVLVNGNRQMSFPDDSFSNIDVGTQVNSPLVLTMAQGGSTQAVGRPQIQAAGTSIAKDLVLGGFNSGGNNTITFIFGVIGAGQIYFKIVSKATS